MKNFITLIISIALVVSLTACGSTKDNDSISTANDKCPKTDHGNHKWQPPTCVEPAKCFWCDAYKDDKIAEHHSWHTYDDGLTKCQDCSMLREDWLAQQGSTEQNNTISDTTNIDKTDDFEVGVAKNIHTAADIPTELMNDKFKKVIDLFSKGFSQSGLNITNATTYDDGETYIFYLDNLEFLGDECEDGALQPRIIYSEDAINNNGAPDKIFFEIANPLKSNGYEETVEVVEDIAEALGISNSGLIDNNYSSSSAWATGEYATFTFPNLRLELTVSNTDGTVAIEIVPIV